MGEGGGPLVTGVFCQGKNGAAVQTQSLTEAGEQAGDRAAKAPPFHQELVDLSGGFEEVVSGR
jgi:hypothetical protein